MAQTLPGYAVMAWFGLVAPAGTPPAIVAKLNDAAMTALTRPEVKAAFANTADESGRVQRVHPERDRQVGGAGEARGAAAGVGGACPVITR